MVKGRSYKAVTMGSIPIWSSVLRIDPLHLQEPGHEVGTSENCRSEFRIVQSR